MIKLKDIVNEIGEASIKPYEFNQTELNPPFVTIQFETDSGTSYEVLLELLEIEDPTDSESYAQSMRIEFAAKTSGQDSYSSSKLTNEGAPLKIMSTVTAIIKEYLKKKMFEDVEYLIYSPSKKSSGETINSNQRNMMYKKFISHAIPGSKEIKITDMPPDTVAFKVK